LAQTTYTGTRQFKVGDSVEATYPGECKKATVVGVDAEGGSYKVHL